MSDPRTSAFFKALEDPVKQELTSPLIVMSSKLQKAR